MGNNTRRNLTKKSIVTQLQGTQLTMSLAMQTNHIFSSTNHIAKQLISVEMLMHVCVLVIPRTELLNIL